MTFALPTGGQETKGSVWYNTDKNDLGIVNYVPYIDRVSNYVDLIDVLIGSIYWLSRVLIACSECQVVISLYGVTTLSKHGKQSLAFSQFFLLRLIGIPTS